MYERGILKIRRLPIPVISVGNLSAGGTGKTSTVRFLAQDLRKIKKTAIVLRGYRRTSKGLFLVSDWEGVKTDIFSAGDEAFLLASLLKGVSVVVAEDRYEGGMFALKELGAELIILDDGFQHRKLHRDLDIVLLKKKDLKDRLLPAGLLREPISSLRRASAIVLSYQDTDPFDFAFEDKPVFKMVRIFCCLRTRDMKKVPFKAVKEREIVAFAGLGDNNQFFISLQRLGFKIKKKISLPDHYHYKEFPIKKEEVYITTFKDIFKLPPVDNVYALDFKVKINGLIEFVKKSIKL